jgi:hypothetical protein
MVSLFYQWYNSRKSSKNITYESAVIGFELLLFINTLSLLKLLFGFSFTFWYKSKLELYPELIIGTIVVGFIISLLAPKKKVKAINYELRDKDIDNLFLIIYIIASFVLFIISAKSVQPVL